MRDQRDRGRLREDYRDAASAAARAPIGLAAVLGLIIAVAGIGALVWWLGVRTSAAAGAGNITKQRNSAQNIAHWSTTFNGEYQRINADVANLGTLLVAATGPGATQQDRVNLTGAQTVCQQDVGAYDADTQNVLAVIPAGLPATVPLSTCTVIAPSMEN